MDGRREWPEHDLSGLADDSRLTEMHVDPNILATIASDTAGDTSPFPHIDLETLEYLRRIAADRVVFESEGDGYDGRKRKKTAEEKAYLESVRPEFQRVLDVVKGLYLEIDKLCQKWPATTISKLTVAEVNKAITAVVRLTESEPDMFVKLLAPFDEQSRALPEQREAVLILRELLNALERFQVRNYSLSGTKRR